MTDLTCRVAIVGAGPYGLAAAAHLWSAKVDVRIFGKEMEFWKRHMPAGMLLRSYWEGSDISDPHGDFTLDRYERTLRVRLPRPVRRDDFISYGQWFQRQVVPDLDGRRVTRIEAASKYFRLILEDGESVWAQRVVIATGIASFAYRPEQFKALPAALASHSSEHCDFSGFAGQRVVVVGGGQSALESAALLNESGASVEVIVRAPVIRWLRYGTRMHAWLHSQANPLRRILYPPSNVGPPGLNWIVDTPDLFKRFPWSVQSCIARRAIRPAGAGWLKPRMNGIRITVARLVLSTRLDGQRARLSLDDGTERRPDHVLLATGFQVNLLRSSLLPRNLLRSLHLTDGYPELTAGFEASVPGLHFVGATAARSFGPLMRFVAGTSYAARALTRCIVGHATNSATNNVGSYD